MKNKACSKIIVAVALILSHAQHSMADQGSRVNDSSGLRERWGFFVDFIDKPLVAINANGGTYDLNQRVTFGWEKPGEVMTQTVSTLDGAVVKVVRFHWDKARGRVVASVPGGDMLMTVSSGSGAVGLLELDGGSLRATYTALSHESLSRISKFNTGNGWVLSGYEVFYEATDAIIASIPQAANVFAQLYVVEKGSAEVMASMQGSKSDAEFQEYLAMLERQSREMEQEKQRKRRERGERMAGFVQGLSSVASAYSEAASESHQMENQLQSAIDQGARYEAAQGQRQHQVSRSESAPAPGGAGSAGASAADSPQAGAVPASADRPAGGKTLRFMMWVSLEVRDGDTHNPICYSNVLDVRGPAGWGVRGLFPGKEREARGIIEGHKAAFIRKCALHRPIRQPENFTYAHNESMDEAGFNDWLARFRAVPVNVSVSF